MDFARGERFHILLDSDDEDHVPAASNSPFDFIGDVKERTASAPAPPTAPTIKGSATGFPAHKKRTRVSAFKQQRAANAKENEASKQTAPSDEHVLRSQTDTVSSSSSSSSSNGGSFDKSERRRIDEENRQRLAAMSPEEIEQERQELFAGLKPALIERLLKRANIDTTGAAYGQDQATPKESENTEEQKPATDAQPAKKVTFEGEPSPAVAPAPSAEPPARTHDEDHDQDAKQASTLAPPPPPSIHFPHPTQPPDLDPNSPTFLADLHSKYYPTLPHDPSKLSWMSPSPSPCTSTSYTPTQPTLAPSSLRFSFTGALLPPSTAAAIPVTAGLHHHGAAPDAAGYTVPELARLARSRVPAQRCVALQTLGRVLFRLGRGEWGDETVLDRAEASEELAWMASSEGMVGKAGPDAEEGEGHGGEEEEAGGTAELVRGLWDCVERERVLEILLREADRRSGHLTARCLAQEALWNWRRGGGRRRKAV